MPNLIYNLEFKIDKAQLAELKNIVDASTTAEVSSLTDKVKSLEKQLKKLKGSQNELNKTDKERIDLSKSQRSQINSLLKVKKVKGTLDKNEIRVLRDVTKSLQRETSATKQGALADSSSIIAKEKLSNEFAQATVTINNATEALEQLEQQQTKTNKAVLGGDKSFSIANQTLFGFGDLAQDASQFSQGAAQGFRAIGNNIAFNAEMFGLLASKTGGVKAAFKTLGSQIFGVGGLILGLNIGITVLTGLLTKSGKKAKEAKEGLDLFGDAAKSSLSEFSDSFEEPEVKIESLEKALDNVTLSLLGFNKETLKSPDRFGGISDFKSDIDLSVASTDALATANQKVSRELFKVNEEGKERTANEKAILEAASDTLIEQIGQAKAQEQVNEVLKDIVEKRKEELETIRQISEFTERSRESDADLERLTKELEIIKETNELTKISLQANLERFSIDQDLFEKQREIRNLNLTEEQEAILLKAERDKADIERQKVTAQQIIDINKQTNKQIDDSNKETADKDKELQREKLEVARQVQSGILNLSRFFAKENKGIALALLGVEKSIAISQVIIDAKQKIFEATAAGAAHTASFNLFGAKLAVSQVALIKAQAVATIAAIASQGLQQGGSISGRGGGGARGGGGGTSSGGNNSQNLFAISGGDRSSRINRPLFDNQQSAFVPRAQGGSQRFAITVNNTFDEQTAASVVADGNEQRREGAISAT